MPANRLEVAEDTARWILDRVDVDVLMTKIMREVGTLGVLTSLLNGSDRVGMVTTQVCISEVRSTTKKRPLEEFDILKK